MTWTAEEARADQALETYGYEVEMHCEQCGTDSPVIHDERTEEPWDAYWSRCDRCGEELIYL